VQPVAVLHLEEREVDERGERPVVLGDDAAQRRRARRQVRRRLLSQQRVGEQLEQQLGALTPRQLEVQRDGEQQQVACE